MVGCVCGKINSRDAVGWNVRVGTPDLGQVAVGVMCLVLFRCITIRHLLCLYCWWMGMEGGWEEGIKKGCADVWEKRRKREGWAHRQHAWVQIFRWWWHTDDEVTYGLPLGIVVGGGRCGGGGGRRFSVARGGGEEDAKERVCVCVCVCV